MPLSKAIGSYEDCRQIFERALAAERGIRITRKDKGSAVQLRHRMNAYRSAMRKESLKIYKEGDPGWNKSPYDHLVLKVEDNILTVTPTTIEELQIEELK